MLAVCEAQDRIALIDLTSGRIELVGRELLPGAIFGSAQSPDGLLVYVVTATNEVLVWDFGAGTFGGPFPLADEGRVAVSVVGLSPDGRQLAVGFSTSGKRFETDLVLSFDTETWREAGRVRLSRATRAHDLLLDGQGNLLTLVIVNAGGNLSSTVSRIRPNGDLSGIAPGIVDVAHLTLVLGYNEPTGGIFFPATGRAWTTRESD